VTDFSSFGNLDGSESEVVDRPLPVESLAPFDPMVHGTEKEMVIYYDETNNIRKLLLTEDGFNVTKYDNFVLGGIAVESGKELPDINGLRSILKIQKNAPEIKFDLVAKGDFEKVLDSKKLGQFFSWLIEHDIKIHYTNLNILNWAILDIVESIVAEDAFREYLLGHRELKNELYRMVSKDVLGFLAILKGYNYPDLKSDSTVAFLKDVRSFVVKHAPVDKNGALSALLEILLKGQIIPGLTFLMHNKPDYVIEGFEDIFINRIARFKNSRHIFDEEKTVQKAIAGIRIVDGDRNVDFSFADSKLTPGIQLSDVMVGFLGKYFTFLERTPVTVLMSKKASLNPLQKQNLKLFQQLVTSTDFHSNALLFRVTTIDSDCKADFFLYGRELPAHILPA